MKTIHYDVRYVNPEAPLDGVWLQLHVPAKEVPALIRVLADGLMRRGSIVTVQVDGRFTPDSGVRIT